MTTQASLCRNLRSLHRKGFTLVEMLVAIALVMLLMLMFAQVFQIAGDSIGRMRGMAENDQRARSLQNIIKGDLDKRTFRWVFPFAADEDTGAVDSKIGDRQGFLYISENNPYDDLDDVLHFTIGANITNRNTDTTPFYGQALNIPDPGGSAPNMNFINQPDMDDSQYESNNTGSSTAAEVVYFVRNGNLYRRQLLLRDQVLGSDPQPTDASKRHIFDPTSSASVVYPTTVPNATTFWADYDYSAVFNLLSMSSSSSFSTGHFNGIISLDNGSGSSIGAISYPPNRYGFSPLITSAYFIGIHPAYRPGRPKEFISNLNTDNIGNFIGRFTLEESSSIDFQYPQGFSTGTILPTDNSINLTLDSNDGHINGPVNFSGGSRRGEDLLLSNVHAFNVQLWDESLQGFVDIGDDFTKDYTIRPNVNSTVTRRINSDYGPRVFNSGNPEIAPQVTNAVYDTWHPAIDLDGTPGNENPPFMPLDKSASAYLPWNSAGPPYTAGQIVFPTSATQLKGQLFYYRCVKDGGPGATEPVWPKSAGLTVNDGTATWLAVDNRKPLRAIRLQIRFLDTTSQQLRQLTMIQSLID